MNSKYFIIIILLIIVINKLYYTETFEHFSEVKRFTTDRAPDVIMPFGNVKDENGENLNVILLNTYFREKEHKDKFLEYKKKGFPFIGSACYLSFPAPTLNPHDDQYYKEHPEDTYVDWCEGWCHCFRNPEKYIVSKNNKVSKQNKDIPKLLCSVSDFPDYKHIKPDPTIKKKYDFIYSCPSDNDECTAGWQSWNRNWELAKKCLPIMCKKYKMNGIIIGRKNCDYTDLCTDRIKIVDYTDDWNQFLTYMKESRFLFCPNIEDASPRVITEAMCCDIPVLLNKNILGGWKYIKSGVSGEFFTSEKDISKALDMITKQNYTPRKHFMEISTDKVYSPLFKDFLKKCIPNLLPCEKATLGFSS